MQISESREKLTKIRYFLASLSFKFISLKQRTNNLLIALKITRQLISAFEQSINKLVHSKKKE